MAKSARAPIAIVGYGCVLPDAANVNAFWENLLAGKSALRTLAEPTFVAHYSQDLSKQDCYYSLIAARVQGYQFDWKKFRMPPAEVELINPMQLMALDAGAQALSAVKQLPKERTGLVLGATGFGWQRDSGLRIRARDMLAAVEAAPEYAALASEVRTRVSFKTLQLMDSALRPVSEDNVVNASASVACGRLAMHFDLKGIHYSVDAGFASALAALDVAIGMLDDGTVDAVVTGGASEMLSPLELAAFAKLGGLATGDLRAFDAAASGTLLGEGVAMFALKRLDDALRDGETIHAVLLGAGGSTDLAKNAIVAPNADGQCLAMTRAWQEAERDPASAGFFECHATGTQVGDASEVAALSMLLESRPARPIPIASAKPFVGHLRAAAGAVGLLRAVLALEHKILPKQIAFDRPNPALELDRRPFAVPTAHQPLAADAVCGVSAFGFGGINYHAVLAAAPARVVTRPIRKNAEPIALVGLGGSFPGADDVPTFWTRLLDGYDATRTIPKERWDVERYFDKDRDRRDTCYTKLGCFLDSFPTPDARWRIPPAALASLDPSHLLVLRAAEAALTDARLPQTIDKRRAAVQLAFLPYQGKKFLADARMHWRSFAEWLERALIDNGVAAPGARAIVREAEARYKNGLPPISEDTLTGYLGNINAARVARTFGFMGPHFVVDSACASTHASIDAAMRALRQGQIDLALTGGVWCDMMPEFFVAACRFQALSAIGSRPFSEGADGFIPGEGAGIFVLRRLSDAERDGQRIHAVLRSVTGSSDGKGRSVLAPTVDGEALAMRRAVEASGVDRESVDYVECHGTGTALGDVVETDAIQHAYGPTRTRPLLIGSVKSNIGHLNAAAGVPALIKTALALEHGVIPPSLKSTPPNPKIGFDRGIIDVVREKRAWPEVSGRPRRAAVSGFGVGGSNMHMIVEQYVAPARAIMPVGPSGVHLSQEKGTAVAIVARDAATLSKRRAMLDGFSGSDPSVLRKQGIFIAKPGPHRVCLAFPGQGPQYPNMARELCAEFAPASAMIERLDAAFVGLTGRKLVDAFWTDDAKRYRQNDEDIHAAVYAVSCAIAATLRQRGLRYEAVLGQSAGMFAALVAADVLTPEEGLRAVLERTRSVLALVLPDPGKMLYVSCAAERARAWLGGTGGYVTIAADNGPGACILSGETKAIEALLVRAKAEGLDAEILPVSHAYHSKVIAQAGERFRTTLNALQFRPPTVDVYSSVDGRCVPAGSSYAWVDHLIAQFSEPVRMPEAVRAAHGKGVGVFVECGPKWPLTSFVDEILAHEKPCAMATMHPKVGEVEQMLRATAELTVLGCLGERAMNEGMSLRSLLDRARVVRHSIEAMIAEPVAVVPSSRPMPAPTPPVRAVTAAVAAPSSRWNDIHESLIKETIARTGYPAEMLELDLDLEADLGIDTVKQLAIVSEVRKGLALEVDPRFKLRDFRTLRALVDHLAQRLGQGPAVPTPATSGTPATSATSAKSETTSPRWNEIRERLLAETVQRTGYPSEMLELDLDLEADLGIDTVKQLAIVGEVRKALGFEVDPRFKLRDFRTLRALIDHFDGRTSAPTASVTLSAPVAESTPIALPVPLAIPAAARSVAAPLVPVAANQTQTQSLPLDAGVCVVVGGTAQVVRAGAALRDTLAAPADLDIAGLWRVVFSTEHKAAEKTQAAHERGERVQWRVAGQPVFEGIVSRAGATLDGAAGGHRMRGTASGTAGVTGLVRLDPGHYAAEMELAEPGAAALIEHALEATALCWAEAHGERTVSLRAELVRVAKAAWTGRRFAIEIELAAAPAGKSRARAMIRNEAGALVAALSGVEGEWPSGAGAGALPPADWQALRTAARARDVGEGVK
ncbi:MAG: acyltransferase domain-containing protein [Deltaproteobacteria bacterium]|nr:acyltransferase domain-containing protein [Deltaproteobacteria bacterium]